MRSRSPARRATVVGAGASAPAASATMARTLLTGVSTPVAGALVEREGHVVAASVPVRQRDGVAVGGAEGETRILVHGLRARRPQAERAEARGGAPATQGTGDGDQRNPHSGPSPWARARPGATLPGGFPITARTTYGHVSDGMICSSRELGVGDPAAASRAVYRQSRRVPRSLHRRRAGRRRPRGLPGAAPDGRGPGDPRARRHDPDHDDDLARHSYQPVSPLK